jgi:hypothetical protein
MLWAGIFQLSAIGFQLFRPAELRPAGPDHSVLSAG